MPSTHSGNIPLRCATVYQCRRPERTAPYQVVRHNFESWLARYRGNLDHLFVLISIGDQLGVPRLSPFYRARLLPFIVPLINNWRGRMLRDRELTGALL